jgi:hypothetical protein
LHFELEIFGIEENAGILLNFAIHTDIALLHQARANAASAETLAKENVL